MAKRVIFYLSCECEFSGHTECDKHGIMSWKSLPVFTSSQTNISQFILVSQKRTAWPVYSDSRTKNSEPVHLRESKAYSLTSSVSWFTNKWFLSYEPVYFRESKAYSLTSVSWFTNKRLLSYEPVHFSESKAYSLTNVSWITNKWLLSYEPVHFKESKAYRSWFTNKRL